MGSFSEANKTITVSVGLVLFIGFSLVSGVFTLTTIYWSFQQNISDIENMKAMHYESVEFMNDRMDRKCGRNSDEIKALADEIEDINHTLIAVGIGE